MFPAGYEFVANVTWIHEFTIIQLVNVIYLDTLQAFFEGIFGFYAQPTVVK